MTYKSHATCTLENNSDSKIFVFQAKLVFIWLIFFRVVSLLYRPFITLFLIFSQCNLQLSARAITFAIVIFALINAALINIEFPDIKFCSFSLNNFYKNVSVHLN